MTGRIKVLDERVINRIAAGEVIERPVSVVKELIENSIDAHASAIRLDLEGGGRKLIRIRDNGLGMSRDDAFLALERHATSKLVSEKDLVGIATMGFRGEALASIASVSRLRLVTRDDSDEEGTEVLIEGGILRKSTGIGTAVGTLIEVRNLFYNVPVRAKFLKSAKVEEGHIEDLITKLALAFPSIGFTYSDEKRVKLDAPAVSSTYERIYTLYSKDVRENLAEVDYTVDDARLHGYVARPPYARSSMRSVLTFVNGRAVRDRVVNAAVTRAFANLMERGRYPLAILFIEIPPHKVDVNVHPQKAEVRFANPKIVFDLILDGVHQSLMGAPFSPPRDTRGPTFPSLSHTPVSRHVQDERPAPAGPVPWHDTRPVSSPAHAPQSPEQPPAELQTPPPAVPGRLPSLPEPVPEPETTRGRFSSLGILGRLPGSFLVLYDEQDLIVMDHHAAHERVIFEELLKSEKRAASKESQQLLIPKILQYSAAEARALAGHLGLLQDAGFAVEEFGERDFAVKAVPAWLGDADLEQLFSGLVELMLDTGLRGDPGRLKEELLKSLACRAALKESERIRPEEIRALLQDLDRHGSVEVCPHGRPLTVRFSFNEIRKKMGRK